MKSSILIILTYLCLLSAEMPERPKVFIDCSYCDMDFIRTEITFVDYVIERQAADVFIMITSQTTGSNGEEYILELIGKNRFEGRNDKIKFNTKNDDSADIKRNKIVKYVKLGMTQYLTQTELSDRIDLIYESDEPIQETEDAWDSWVFSLGGNGYFNGRKYYDSRYMSGYANAGRVTDEWIFRSSFYISHNYDDYRDYGYKIRSESKSADVTIVKSLTDHWSAGIVSGWNRSDYSNRENYFYLYPRIEYDIYPYSESSRRLLRIMYGAGANYSDYYDTTIYGKKDELRFKHSLEVALSVKKEWGNIYLSLTGSNYLHDFDLKRLDSYAQVSLNIFRGLSLNLSGGYSMINDQIGLSSVGYSDEELLLQKKEMETSYSYWSSVGLSYTFGSIYNNVVNPRFGN
jgi:hypothetical protein